MPRVWEKIAEKMQEAGKANSGLKKAIGNWAKKVATRHHTMVRKGKMKPEQFDFQYSLAKKLIFSRIHQALGLDQTQNNHYYPTTMSGAAPLNLETFLYFQSIDILLPELYGCSETNGPSTTNGAGTFLFLRLCLISQGLKQVSVVMWLAPRPSVRETRVQIPSQHGNLVKLILVWVFFNPSGILTQP